MSGDRLVRVWKLGRIGYEKALKLQTALANQHRLKDDASCDTLLLLEHHPVYTIGIRTDEYGEEEINRLKTTGAEFHKTNRGGLITYHGPGQLVAYPILNLKHFKTSMRWYVCHIEKTIIHLCHQYGLNAETSPHTGVWINDNKVCAIGVHGSRFVTTHGLALNCNTDLKWFSHIVPCGIRDKGVTSLTNELKSNLEIESVIPEFLKSFAHIFECNCVDYPEEEKMLVESVC